MSAAWLRIQNEQDHYDNVQPVHPRDKLTIEDLEGNVLYETTIEELKND